ncbi:Ribokinase-like protein [Terfezia claveryi]|nr:Ribokinase-like protein [Terfezia claveryi]
MPISSSVLNDSDRVLTIASHVVFGYVGNSVTTFVLQSLGLEVSALNTVQFSNHTGYKQWTGYRTTSEQISQLWDGLKQSEIVEEYGMLLTGYVPGADGVVAVGKIGMELKKLKRHQGRPLFWVLDPVMGDGGRLYVSEEVVPVYKSLVPHADLITPNQFETEVLCGIKIDSLSSLSLAIDTLHSLYQIPHIVITSVTFSPDFSTDAEEMLCAGSSIISTGASRIFFLPVPIIPGIFVGTGDMFSALTLARFREQAELAGLLDTESWLSDDSVEAVELPLARALEQVLGSMHRVLERTRVVRDRKLEAMVLGEDKKMDNVRRMKASELQLVKGQSDLLQPGDDYKALPLDMDTNGVN